MRKTVAEHFKEGNPCLFAISAAKQRICLQREIDGKDMISHFHFETLPLNPWIIAVINIHAGVKAMKTLLEVGTQWVRNKISHFSSCSMLL